MLRGIVRFHQWRLAGKPIFFMKSWSSQSSPLWSIESPDQWTTVVQPHYSNFRKVSSRNEYLRICNKPVLRIHRIGICRCLWRWRALGYGGVGGECARQAVWVHTREHLVLAFCCGCHRTIDSLWTKHLLDETEASYWNRPSGRRCNGGLCLIVVSRHRRDGCKRPDVDCSVPSAGTCHSYCGCEAPRARRLAAGIGTPRLHHWDSARRRASCVFHFWCRSEWPGTWRPFLDWFGTSLHGVLSCQRPTFRRHGCWPHYRLPDGCSSGRHGTLWALSPALMAS